MDFLKSFWQSVKILSISSLIELGLVPLKDAPGPRWVGSWRQRNPKRETRPVHVSKLPIKRLYHYTRHWQGHTHTRIRGERRVTKRYEKCLPPPLLPFSIQEGGDGYLLPSFRCAKVEQTLLARTHRESDALFASIRTDDDAYFPSSFFSGEFASFP